MGLKKDLVVLRHWLWLIVLGAALLGAAVFIYSSRQTPIYRAYSRYLIDTPPGREGTSNYAELLYSQKLAETYVEQMKAAPIMQAVLNELSGILGPAVTVQDLQGMVSVSVGTDSLVVVISAMHPDYKTAADIANTTGLVFASENRRMQGTRYTESIDRLEEQLATIDLLLADLETQINAISAAGASVNEVELSRLNRQLNEQRNDYNRAFQQRQDLLVDRDLKVYTIMPFDPANRDLNNPRPASPRTQLATLIAMVVGAGLALGVALLIEYLDDTVKTPEEVLGLTDLSTLATISFIPGNSQPERLVTSISPRAPVSEAYRVLRTNLSFAAIDSGLRSVAVTSSAPGEGKSTTCANMAVVLAQAGKRVVVVDGDLRRPTQHKIFELANSQGLTTALLNNNTPVSQHLQDTRVRGVRLLASGPLPPNPAELLNSNRMQEVIAALTEECDIVLIDSPPVLTVADAAIVAPMVSGMLLVAEIGRTRREALRSATERLHAAGATVFGVVLNRSRQGGLGYYQYNYEQQYYNYEYAPANAAPARSRWGLPGWLTGSGQKS